jgi:hypothetical protein
LIWSRRTVDRRCPESDPSYRVVDAEVAQTEHIQPNDAVDADSKILLQKAQVSDQDREKLGSQSTYSHARQNRLFCIDDSVVHSKRSGCSRHVQLLGYPTIYHARIGTSIDYQIPSQLAAQGPLNDDEVVTIGPKGELTLPDGRLVLVFS